MPWTLTNPLVVPNGTRLTIADVLTNDVTQEMRIVVELRTPPATNHVISRQELKVTATRADKLVRRALVADTQLKMALELQPSALSIASAYTGAVDAWRAGNTAAARRTALEAWCGANGVFDPVTLAGA